MAQDDKKKLGEKAEDLDKVIDEVLRSSRSLVEHLESLLDRARALIKENKRLLNEQNTKRK